MNCLRSLGCRDRRFESYSRHGCLYVCAFFCVCVVLWWADHWSKESYRESDIKKLKWKEVSRMPYAPKVEATGNNNNNNNNNTSIINTWLALPQSRWLVGGFSPWRPGFNPSIVHVVFVGFKMALGEDKFSSRNSVFPCQLSFNQRSAHIYRQGLVQ
jgi:hypothetical protein